MQVAPDRPGVNDPGRGRRLGVDVGTVRIGVAASDRSAMLATPVETVHRETFFRDDDGADIDRLLELVAEYEVVEIVVGLPRDLKGNGSKSVQHAQDIARRLQRRLQQTASRTVVRMGDERLTTVVATHSLRASGVNSKAGRKVIDQAAAVEILQSWLDGRARELERPRPVPKPGDMSFRQPQVESDYAKGVHE